MVDAPRPSAEINGTDLAPEDVIRVFVVDDHPAIREALAETMKRREDLRMVGEASTASEALAVIKQSNPDVAIVDISLQEGHGLDLIGQIRLRFPSVRIVIFSMYEETVYAERAIRAGALAYVMKTESTQQVIKAVRQAVRGQLYLSRRMSSRILTRIVRGKVRPDLSFAVDDLTDRELVVFQMLGEGLGVNEIARHLRISRKTVEAYRRRAKEKLRLESVGALLQYAIHWTSSGKEREREMERQN